MGELEIFLRIAFLGFGLLLFILTFASFIRVKEMKMAFATAGFAVFLIEGIILVAGVFLKGFEEIVTMNFLVGANFIALVFFYLSIIKR